jgi:hypothetical protein
MLRGGPKSKRERAMQAARAILSVSESRDSFWKESGPRLKSNSRNGFSHPTD